MSNRVEACGADESPLEDVKRFNLEGQTVWSWTASSSAPAHNGRFDCLPFPPYSLHVTTRHFQPACALREG